MKGHHCLLPASSNLPFAEILSEEDENNEQINASDYYQYRVNAAHSRRRRDRFRKTQRWSVPRISLDGQRCEQPIVVSDATVSPFDVHCAYYGEPR
jgi:hypothetical protein